MLSRSGQLLIGMDCARKDIRALLFVPKRTHYFDSAPLG